MPVQTCPECGQPLPKGSSEVLCPVCALRSVANGGRELVPEAPSGDGGSKIGNAGPQPPAASLVDRPCSSPPAPRPASLPRSFGDYELLDEIARGGMGVVYRARQKRLNRIVALKLIAGGPLASAAAIQRFQAEAQTAAALQHPNIVAIHEVGEHDGQPFFSMDYVEGRNLAELLRDGPLPPGRAASYAKTIAEAVEYAHRQGILHRDLKPSNVLIDQFDQPRVADFGLAKRIEDSQLSTLNSQLTVSGQVLGSPNFMAPEQAQGRHEEIGPHSDVYSIGALLYHLLTGRPPFQAATLTEVLRQVVTTEPVAPRRLNPSLPHDLETICLKCLEKDIPRRYPTTQMLAEELGRFLEGKPVLARPVGRLGKVWRWGRRNPRLALTTGAALLSLLIGLAGVTWQWRRAEAEGLLARRHAYAADMNLVQQALEDNDLGRARERLARHRPARKSQIANRKSQIEQKDLRSWEWRYLWGRSRGEERFTLHQYSNPVSALAFSPDGKWLAVRAENEVLVLWDAVTKQPVAELPARGGKTWRWRNKALAFSPHGNLLAWSNADGKDEPLVSLRDLSAERELQPLPHASRLVSLAFSPDAKRLATLTEDGAVRIWDVASGQVLTNFSVAPMSRLVERSSAGEATTAAAAAETTDGPPEPGSPSGPTPIMKSLTHTAHYGWVLFSPDGRWLAVGASQPLVRMWDWTAGKEAKPLVLPAAAGGITALAFSPDSARLAASGGSGHNDVHVWDLATRAEQRLLGHRGSVVGLAFSPDGQRLASASADQTLRLWDVAGKAEPRSLQGNTAEVWAIAWSPDGRDLVTGARDGTVRYWDPASDPTAPYAVLPASIWFSGLAFAPDSKTFLAVGLPEGVVERWDTATLRRVEPLPFLGTNHLALDLSTDGRWLALGDTNGHVQVWEAWDSPARRLAADLVLPEAWMIGVHFSPGVRYLNAGVIARDGLGMTKFWDVPTWREVNLQGLNRTNLNGFDFSPKEGQVAFGFVDSTAAWWDLVTGKRQKVLPCHDRGGAFVRFSADGRWFATAGVQGLITLWDVATARPTPIGPDHPLELQSLIFTPDGRRLITTGSSSGDLFWLWDVATGRHLATLPGLSGRFYNCLIFSPDGNTLYAGSMEGTVLIWRAPSWEEIEAVE